MEATGSNFSQYEKMVESTSAWSLPDKWGKPNKVSNSYSRMYKKIKNDSVLKMSESAVVSIRKDRESQNKNYFVGLWAAMEKVHGANFCFVCDEQSVRPAKRSDIIAEDDDFFGYRTMFERYQQNARQLFGIVSNQYKTLISSDGVNLKRVLIYGELFGGCYPTGDNNVQDTNIQAVQNEILYCPNLEFYGFDIAVELEDSKKIYLDYIDVIELFSETQFFYAIPLYIGSLDECVNLSVDFETTIPKRLQLHSLSQKNFAEGYVIKPLCEIELSSAKGSKRAIVKKKAEAFSERVANFATTKLTSQTTEMVAVLSQFVNKNRLNNVFSKIGRKKVAKGKDASNQIMEVVDLLVKDALHDAMENQNVSGKWNKLSKSDQTKVTEEIKSIAKSLVESNMS
eukprot:TRINITY_DN5724_c0_g1_i1.p1 TRINITY_DN5724_c0_g1~~TRINITY_DN5724_c0_g1_i1.p1  ORF type:complete len:398 (+),score=70.13 TRINITY_DN5724_c0_g1_i1:2-1195(+)